MLMSSDDECGSMIDKLANRLGVSSASCMVAESELVEVVSRVAKYDGGGANPDVALPVVAVAVAAAAAALAQSSSYLVRLKG